MAPIVPTLASDRTRRAPNPSAKQKEIVITKLAKAAAKQPKPTRNDPTEVQKRREVGTGSITSKTIGIVKPIPKPRTQERHQQQQSSGTAGISSTTSLRKTLARRDAQAPLAAQPTLRHGKESRPPPKSSGLAVHTETLSTNSNHPPDDDSDQQNDEIVTEHRGAVDNYGPDLPVHEPEDLDIPGDLDDEARWEVANDRNGGVEDIDSSEQESLGMDTQELSDGSESEGNTLDFEDDGPGESSDFDQEEQEIASRKRRLSSNSSDDPHQRVKMIRVHKRVQHDGRGRRKDFDEDSQIVIDLANSIYEALLAADCIYPDAVTDSRFVKKAWSDACEELDLALVITPEVYKMITRRATHLRSRSKLVARSVVAQEYGFKTGQTTKVKNDNIALAAKLKNDHCFTRPASQLDKPHEERSGLYRHKAIRQFLNAALFANKSALGIEQAKLFGSAMPKAAIAFALVMLEFSIHEWESGTFVPSKFFEHEWKIPYAKHIADLQRFETAMQEVDAFNKLAVKLLSDARSHAGMGPISGEEPLGNVSTRTLEAELRAYQEGTACESDDD